MSEFCLQFNYSVLFFVTQDNTMGFTIACMENHFYLVKII